MTGHDLLIWRLRFLAACDFLNQQDAARVLGISRRQYQYLEAGERHIPRAIELACRYLSEHPDEMQRLYYGD